MASHRYLLDTNILSDLVRHPSGHVAERIITVGEHAICTSIVVACELRFGAARRGSAELFSRIDQLLKVIDVLPLSEGADSHYGEIRNDLEKSGTPIGPNDLLIAAHARSVGLTLVTDNVREFNRVPELAVENWLSAGRERS